MSELSEATEPLRERRGRGRGRGEEGEGGRERERLISKLNYRVVPANSQEQ